MRITTFITFLFFTVSSVCGQAFEPMELAKKIFGEKKFPNIERYITGEYNGKPSGQDLKEKSTTKFTLLQQTEDRAVVNMTVLDSTAKGFDTYLHFEKDSIWKMNAFRGLALTGIIEQMVIELGKMKPEEIDEIIKKSKKNKRGEFVLFKSKEDYDYMLGNARLIIELDDNIEKHFLSNQSEFDRIKDALLKNLKDERFNGKKDFELGADLKSDYRKLFIASVSAGKSDYGNSIDFLIGGMVDNKVGYMYIENEKDLPKINPNRLIMVREIGNGWYIYKTT
ncbi:hypothetical protein [Sporocytophaga myxococcoides]|uniref:hypothetical protein n=1 Tax=Sporocytophaga myxococcoides TaxID=153721 RepID=UPI00048C4919|nr:hypothetical protein [Sporocytophaga myxococcoides]